MIAAGVGEGAEGFTDAGEFTAEDAAELAAEDAEDAKGPALTAEDAEDTEDTGGTEVPGPRPAEAPDGEVGGAKAASSFRICSNDSPSAASGRLTGATCRDSS